MARLHLSLWSTGQAPQWPRSHLWEQNYQWAVWAHGHSECKNFTVPLQTSEQVEWEHQMLMWMIGTLGKDQKADWPKHLPELMHAYNSMRLAVTGYTPHYLIFGWWLHLPINFHFPTIANTGKHQDVDHYIADLHEWLHKAFKEAPTQSSSEAER